MHAQPLRITSVRSVLGSLGIALLAMACEDDPPRYVNLEMETASEQPCTDDGNDSQGSSGSQSSGSSGSGNASTNEGTGGSVGLSNGGAGGSASNAEPEPEPDADTEVSVTADINVDTLWTADKTYVLEGTSPIFVVDGVTLTIEPGTTVKGGGVGTALVVTRGSRLLAEGTAEQPIVFTSNVNPGLRSPGDWGGVVLLGDAPLNEPAGAIEGIAANDPHGAYGGPAAGEGDPTSDCGTLKYVRIEFAGYQYSLDNELNSLTLGGCGTRTVIDYVQTHRGFDDGIEVFGGTVDIKHAVITNSTDDGLDWDRGWTGRGQFIIVRTDPSVSDTAIEADNRDRNNGAAPVSNPTLFNLTLVGDAGSKASPGLVLRRGTFGQISDAIVTGFPVAAIDIRDPLSAAAAATGQLTVAGSIFFNNGTGGNAHADVKVDASASGTNPEVPDALDEGPWLAEGARSNKIDVDPLLPDAYNQTAPNFLPPAGSPAASGAVSVPPDPFFEPITYSGALPPGGEDWTKGWTSYPAN